MHVKSLFLADAAMIQPDNTFSVLRGGIDTFNIAIPEGIPLSEQPPTKMSLIAIVELDLTEMGRLHSLELSLMDADGQRIIPEIRNNFQTQSKQGKGYHNILLELLIKFNKPGRYSFYVNVDRHELGTFPFQVNFSTVKMNK